MTDHHHPVSAPRRGPGRRSLFAAGVLALAATGFVALRASDHQDTPEVELSPRMDLNDVWVFPGSSDARIVLGITLSSPLTPATTAAARFDPNALYQIKVDNTGDAREDLVFQVIFDDSTNAAGQVVGAQRVSILGPVAPRDTGPDNRLAAVAPTMTGSLGTVFGSATGMQVFAGPRDDPFYIDLEQFFRIVPDRRPSRGALAALGPMATASAFRPACPSGTPPANATPFDGTRGCAVDFLRGFNALSIVIELPESALRGSAPEGRIGVWATISR